MQDDELRNEMTENPSNAVPDGGSATAPNSRPGSRLAIGAVLWVLCFVAIVFGWFQWRQRHLELKNETASESEEETGRSTKQIKLVPQQDGTFAAREVIDEKTDDIWDAAGIEDFSFTDTNGQTLSKKDLLGKPFIIAFIFTNCRGPCPNVMKRMRELQDQLKGYDFNLVTLTVDPERDTGDVLKNFGESYGADFNRWKFVTGSQADIYGLIQRSFKMPVEETKGDARKPGFEIIHSTNIMLVNAEGRVVGKFNSMRDEEMVRLKKELKRIAPPSDAAKSAEGSKADE